VLFAAGALLVGLLLIPPYVRWAHRLHSADAAFAVILSVVFVYAWGAEAVGGLAAITGAYLAGVLIGRTEVAEASLEAAKAIGEGILIPLFLVSVGLAARFDPIVTNPTLVIVLTLVAVATKIVGCGLGALGGRLPWRDSLRVGLGMVPRGEVTLVTASLALRVGAITEGVLGVAVFVTLVTILVEPLLLRVAYLKRPVPATAAEA
jgi:Kef-type K+ transport system membrane component KefB